MSDQSEVLNAITAPDAYTSGATIEGTPIRRIVLNVSNQAIYWQLQRSSGGGGVWDNVEVYQIPGSRSIIRPGVTGIRIRAAIKAASLPAGSTQAVVSIEAVK